MAAPTGPKPLPLQTHTRKQKGGVERKDGEPEAKTPTPSTWLTDTPNKLSFKLMFLFFSSPHLLTIPPPLSFLTFFSSSLLLSSFPPLFFNFSVCAPEEGPLRAIDAGSPPTGSPVGRTAHHSISLNSNTQGFWQPTEVDALSLYIQQ